VPLVPTDREAVAAQQRWRNGQEPALQWWISNEAPPLPTKRRARPVHSRGDGLPSPWGGVVTLYGSPHPSHDLLFPKAACQTRP
jgi:hypothetical protein